LPRRCKPARSPMSGRAVMARVTSPPPGFAAPLKRTERSSARFLLDSMRPEQWTKNLLVFAGVVFGGRLIDPRAAATALGTFALFCALSGAVYLFNDVADREADKNHPLKKRRPIASNQLSTATALVAGCLLGLAGVTGAFVIRFELGLIAAAYVG